MSRFRDLRGERFGELVVLRREENGKGEQTRWRCVCDCGKETVVYAGNLVRGYTRSCGCTRNEKAAEALSTHRETKTRLYRIWNNMLTRCYNKTDPHYIYYGLRGVEVCDEWKKYEAFRSWALSTGYNESLTIDRINVNGNYNPGNCKWATQKEQANNKRTNRHIEYNGQRKTVAEWAESCGMDYRTLWGRLYVQGWTVERALTTPLRLRKDRETI